MFVSRCPPRARTGVIRRRNGGAKRTQACFRRRRTGLVTELSGAHEIRHRRARALSVGSHDGAGNRCNNVDGESGGVEAASRRRRAVASRPEVVATIATDCVCSLSEMVHAARKVARDPVCGPAPGMGVRRSCPLHLRPHEQNSQITSRPLRLLVGTAAGVRHTWNIWSQT